jgi:hypothetical protein
MSPRFASLKPTKLGELMGWDEATMWWNQIPARVTLKHADVVAIDAQNKNPKSPDFNLEELLDDTLVSLHFATYFKRCMDGAESKSSWAWDEIQTRANAKSYQIQGGFNLLGLTLEEVDLRVKRTQINLATLRGIEQIGKLSLLNQLEDTPLNLYSEGMDFEFDAYLKFLNPLSDDEIAELAAIAEARIISWMPAHKDVLIQAYDRSEPNKFRH